MKTTPRNILPVCIDIRTLWEVENSFTSSYFDSKSNTAITLKARNCSKDQFALHNVRWSTLKGVTKALCKLYLEQSLEEKSLRVGMWQHSKHTCLCHTREKDRQHEIHTESTDGVHYASTSGVDMTIGNKDTSHIIFKGVNAKEGKQVIIFSIRLSIEYKCGSKSNIDLKDPKCNSRLLRL